MEGWEGFMAVRYGPGEWALYFDRDNDRLDSILSDSNMKRLEVSLVRKEMKQGKPEENANIVRKQ